MPAYFIKRLTSRQRNRRTNIQLGLILTFIAGAVNTSGFLTLGSYTSHMTGIVSSIGTYVVQHKMALVAMALSYVLAFVSGAITSTLITNWARSHALRSEFALTFMLEAILLFAYAMFAEHLIFTEFFEINTATTLLCFIMGLQNAIITKISRADIRTTHVTGIITDIGIQIGYHLYALVKRSRDLPLHPERLSLHVAILTTFAFGSVVGAIAYSHIGFTMVMPLALVLFIIAIVPIMADLKLILPKLETD